MKYEHMFIHLLVALFFGSQYCEGNAVHAKESIRACLLTCEGKIHNIASMAKYVDNHKGLIEDHLVNLPNTLRNLKDDILKEVGKRTSVLGNEIENLRKKLAEEEQKNVKLQDMLDSMQSLLNQTQSQILEMDITIKHLVPGPPGPKGEAGLPGTPGSIGLTGIRGPKGDSGPRGKSGQPGIPGAKGDAGTPGLLGPQGLSGLKGDAGPQGHIGPDGLPGVPGPKGDAGRPGLPGLQGPKGDAGPQGHQILIRFAGIPGLKGDAGLPGLPGDPGPKDEAGLSGLPGLGGLPDAQCPEIAETEKLTVTYERNRDVNTKAYFRCLEPFIVYGQPQVTCEQSGQWSGPAAECRLPTCSLPAVYDSLPEGIENVMLYAEDINEENVPYGFSINLSCDGTRLVFKGNSTAICNKDGNWTVDKNLKCVQGCTRVQPKRNSTLQISSDKDTYEIGETLTFSCPKGMELSPDVERIMCVSTGWIPGNIPDCQ